MFDQDPIIGGLSRRALLGGIGGAGLMAAGTPALAATGHTLDFSNRRDQLTALIKMRASMDNRIVMGGVKGYYYGVVNNKMTPLYGVLAGTLATYKQVDEWNYEGASFEVAYFTDWETGELLETFDNPYTGETVEVPQTRSGPSKLFLSLEGRRAPSDNPALAGLDINHRFITPRNDNGTVVLVEEIRVGTPDGFSGPSFHYNEVTTYRAQMADVANPDVMLANDSTHFNGIVSWRPWLKMSGHPGHLFGTATGGRFETIEDYPPYYVELTNKHHPDVFSDPAALLASADH
ncbi:MAG: DUF1838 family protein [Rhodospirillaceae bacterium]